MAKTPGPKKDPRNRLSSLTKEYASELKNISNSSFILAIDPGNTDSGWITYYLDDDSIQSGGLLANEDMLKKIQSLRGFLDHMVVEMIADNGRSDDSLFETAFWAGRFVDRSKLPHTKIYRYEVKQHLTGSVTTGDSDVRKALLGRFGKEQTKNCKRDVWQALGLAVTFADYIRRL